GARRASSDEIKALFDRIRLDEVHHDVVFRRILEKMKKKGEEGAVGSSSASRRGLRPAFTLGSLKREGESG
ncbi:MAG TPA: hypothetical protein GX507_08230, partial [Clostridia bacterium]|nr:hypothetical protein [Clostridia bacterium]